MLLFTTVYKLWYYSNILIGGNFCSYNHLGGRIVISFVKKGKNDDKVEYEGVEQEEIQHLIRILDEVEEVAIQITMHITNYNMLQNKKDTVFPNKLERYLYLKEFLCRIFKIINPKGVTPKTDITDAEIIDYIFLFRKQFLC